MSANPNDPDPMGDYRAKLAAKGINAPKPKPLDPRIRKQMKKLGFTDPDEKPDPRDGLILVRADEVRAERVRYLWADRIPLKGCTIGPGEEGIGKSTVMAQLAARVTRGTLEGDLHGKPKHVLVIAPEDQIAAVCVPRLEQAGADLSMVTFVQSRRIGEADEDVRGIEVPRDLPTIGDLCDELDVALVWIDSLVTTMPQDSKSVSYKDVSSVLHRMGDFAEKHGLAVVAPWHLNKAAGSDTALRMMDSRAFRTATRSVLLFVGDPERPGEGLIALDKTNAAELNKVPAIRWRMRSAAYTVEEFDPDTGEVAEIPASCGVAEFIGIEPGFGQEAARALLSPSMERADDPKSWLRKMLSEGGTDPLLGAGEVWRADVAAAAGRMGFSDSSVKRAATQLGVIYREIGFAGKPPRRATAWSLPSSSEIPQWDRSPYIQLNEPNGPTGETLVDLSLLSGGLEPQSAQSVRPVGRKESEPTDAAPALAILACTGCGKPLPASMVDMPTTFHLCSACARAANTNLKEN